MTKQWHVFLSGWLDVPWALDEDLSWVERSLSAECRWSSFPFARVVHAAWPVAIGGIPASALRDKFVICQADNPPSFYLGSNDFGPLTRRVDLWIARSREALSQFRLLGLPVAHVPYAVDPSVFRPLGNKSSVRQSLGIGEAAFVIGNFHRDTEGSDLGRPKKQKGPDIFFEIARRLHARVPETVVLLGGPRRHWLLNALRAAGVPVVFAGEEPGTIDDYKRNILPRVRLNELYQALDVCLISSRWEGGPYSALESLSAGTAAASSPVGAARDVLPSDALYSSVEQAVEMLVGQARTGSLTRSCLEAAQRAALTNGPEAIRQAYLHAYSNVPRGGTSLSGALRSAATAGWGRFVPARKESAPEFSSWQLELDSFRGRDEQGLIEYPLEADRAQLFRTAASIKTARQPA